MGIRINKTLLICIVSFLVSSLSYGQSLQQGREAIASKDFEKAKEIFSRIIRQQPGNASVNTWYGQACYETGDYALALKHLTFAANRRVVNGYFYLAKTQIELYLFEDAVANFELFLERSKDGEMISEAEEQKARAQRAASMLRGVEDVEVIDSLVVDKASFLSHYKIGEEAGAIYRYQDFFQGQNSGSTATVYENQRKDKIIYGLPAQGRGYDLFTQVKLMDKFSDAKPLPDVINSEFDENYPFIMPDGATIYYATNDPEKSIGGFDIMITRYSTSTDGYLTPENVGMPFNSLANDYMLVIDDSHGVGWFASDRNQPEDQVCIYLFIPNSEKRVIETESSEERITLASLSGIKATQKREDYSAILEEIANSSKKEEIVEAEFVFVISDLLVYNFRDEFVSSQAKVLFDRFTNAKAKLSTLNKELEELRDEFDKSTRAKRATIAPRILALEQSIPELLVEVERLEIECRNTETKQLRK